MFQATPLPQDLTFRRPSPYELNILDDVDIKLNSNSPDTRVSASDLITHPKLEENISFDFLMTSNAPSQASQASSLLHPDANGATLPQNPHAQLTSIDMAQTVFQQSPSLVSLASQLQQPSSPIAAANASTSLSNGYDDLSSALLHLSQQVLLARIQALTGQQPNLLAKPSTTVSTSSQSTWASPAPGQALVKAQSPPSPLRRPQTNSDAASSSFGFDMAEQPSTVASQSWVNGGDSDSGFATISEADSNNPYGPQLRHQFSSATPVSLPQFPDQGSSATTGFDSSSPVGATASLYDREFEELNRRRKEERQKIANRMSSKRHREKRRQEEQKLKMRIKDLDHTRDTLVTERTKLRAALQSLAGQVRAVLKDQIESSSS